MPRRREGTLLHLWRIVALGSFPSWDLVTDCTGVRQRGQLRLLKIAQQR
jgi:hypothetical protein